MLGGKVVLSQDDRTPARLEILAESWRLGPDAPVTGLLPFMDDSLASPRLRAVYSLGRLRAPEAGNRLLLVLRDQEPYIRSLAARALTRGYAESAKLAVSSVAELLVRAADEANPQVRINALRSLASYEDSTLAGKLVPLLDDPMTGIQVSDHETLGELGGVGSRQGFGAGRWAGRAARCSGGRRSWRWPKPTPTAFTGGSAAGGSSNDWLDRAAAAQGTAMAGPGASPAFLADRDGRVVAAGLQAWSDKVKGPDPDLLAAARPLLAHRDAAVRSVAADIVARAADPADLPALARMYSATGHDSFPEAAIVGARTRSSPSGRADRAAQARVDREFLQRLDAACQLPDPPLGRREVARGGGTMGTVVPGRDRSDPAGLSRPGAPLSHGSGLARASARHHRDRAARPDRDRADRTRCPAHRGQLPAPGRSPLLRPQPVAPRGAQLRGPGRRPAGRRVRRSGRCHPRRDQPQPLRRARCWAWRSPGRTPASSQWFINLTAQPHLDGTYTVFGQVVERRWHPPAHHAGRRDSVDREEVAEEAQGVEEDGDPDDVRLHDYHVPATRATATSPGTRLLAALALLSPLCVCLPAPAVAQFFAFGQNKIQYRKLDWRVIKGPHVDLYYYPAEADLAPPALAYAEASYDTLSAAVRSRRADPASRSIVYASHTDFEQTNILPFTPPEGLLGATDFLKRRVALPFRGNFAEFRHTMRHEMVHVFQLDLLVEDATTVAPLEPDRRSPSGGREGLAELWSGGQDARDEMIMRDLTLSGRLPRAPTAHVCHQRDRLSDRRADPPLAGRHLR